MNTVYQQADQAMRVEIKRYLSLAQATRGFSVVREDHLQDNLDRLMFAAGLGLHVRPGDNLQSPQLVAEWERKIAVPFDIERSVTVGVYQAIRPFAEELYNDAEQLTKGFSSFDANELFKNPHLLPILQHLAGVFSKANLKKEVGSLPF